MEIVFATRNRKKIEEMKRILGDFSVSVLTLDDFPGCPEVEEEEDTFEGNATKKAMAVARFTRKPALADDSGLEVYALGGAPGARSARYAGEEADDRKNIDKLLLEMHAIPEAKRGGRFVCCIALAFPDGKVETFFGTVGGRIGIEAKGDRGFGYDPIFYPEGHTRTFAEMEGDEKDSLSHRGKAIEELRRYLGEIKPGF